MLSTPLAVPHKKQPQANVQVAPTPEQGEPVSNPADKGAETAAILNSVKFTILDKPALIISGPSGTGKSTLLKRLLLEFPEKFGFSVSHTTRTMRNNEVNGKDYHFIHQENFNKMIQESKFVEWAQYGSNYYGTTVDAVKSVISDSKVCILDIDMQGVQSIKSSGIKAIFIFIAPPDLATLESRLRKRGTDAEQDIIQRLKTAKLELEYAESGIYDYTLINDNLEQTYAKLRDYVTAHVLNDEYIITKRE